MILFPEPAYLYDALRTGAIRVIDDTLPGVATDTLSAQAVQQIVFDLLIFR
jgi:hypothetical protein